MNSHSKRLAWAAAALFLVATATAGAVPAVVELNRVVAVVDDNVITAGELERRTESVKVQLERNGTELPPDSVLRRQVLERLIVERLELDRAQQLGLRVDDEVLNRTLARIASDSGLSLEQFREALARDGVAFAQVREEVRNEMLIARLQEREVKSRVKVSDHELAQALERQADRGQQNVEYLLSQILIAVPEAADAEQVRQARARAEALLEQIRAGAEFRQLAIAHSDGQQALEGGSLGWRRGDQLPTLFSDLVADMTEGEVRGPVRSGSGFHLVRLDGRRGEQRHLVTQRHARHILIRTNELVSDYDARTRLERLRDRILSGEEFAKLARTHSEDPGSARDGGDLGWNSPGKFVPAFEEALDRLEVGAVSEPFRTDFGWHIVQLVDRRDHDDTETYRRNRVHQALRERKAEEELQAWLRRLRDEAYVDIRLDG